MRTEAEMYELILSVARGDARIRAVYLNGSRANPAAPRDLFQDYDVVYVVEETASFLADEGWVDVFGETILVQEPDRLDLACGKAADVERFYGYLMLFRDGSRIDLHLETKQHLALCYTSDSLTVPLLDKDSCLPALAPSSDEGYWVRSPSKGEYDCCCNDFWWCTQNIAKGIWRGELPYATAMREQVVRSQLDRMVCWWIGTRHEFRVSAGKMGKYFSSLLPAEHWLLYRATYSGAENNDQWNALFAMCALFRTLAPEVGHAFDFPYPAEDDRAMTGYLEWVRDLPHGECE